MAAEPRAAPLAKVVLITLWLLTAHGEAVVERGLFGGALSEHLPSTALRVFLIAAANSPGCRIHGETGTRFGGRVGSLAGPAARRHLRISGRLLAGVSPSGVPWGLQCPL